MGKEMRDIYGETLVELGAENNDIVVLDADLSGSTKSKLFAQRYPERFFNMGIAEADMMACAAGLASVGKVPFVNSFAVFLTTNGLLSARTQICYGGMNVKLAGAYAGMSDAMDGASHHALEDLALMQALPGMRVLVPCDAESTRRATRLAARMEGPVYLRLSRTEYPDIYPRGTEFEPGRAQTLREGADGVIFAIGLMVHKALEAAERLAAEGLQIRVVDLFSVKPLDEECVVRAARECGAVVCAEEHQLYGGAGSTVARALVGAGVGVPTEFVAVPDVFTETGAYGDLQKKFALDAEGVAAAMRRAVARK